MSEETAYDHVKAFHRQADSCDALGSPFTAALLHLAAEDFGHIAPLFAAHGAWRSADVAPLRFAGALNAAVLAGRAPDLAALYPPAGDWSDMGKVWRAALRLVEEQPDWISAFLGLPPQTNEIRRSIALLPAFHRLGAAGPLHLLELGASAGLNLNWDRFRYETDSWRWGPTDASAPLITTDWRGPPPALTPDLQVASRAGCDINPLDITDPEERLRLKAYIWPDQIDRVERFERGAELAVKAGTRVDQADAGQWLEARLKPGLPEGVTVIYHSIAWQYFTDETQARAEAAMRAARASATPQRQLAWLRFEYNSEFGHAGQGFTVDMLHWPGNGQAKAIARAHPHAQWVEML